MKSLIAICFMLVATQAKAQPLEGFFGKYKVGKCSFEGVVRAYVGYQPNRQGLKDSVLIQLYGDEATSTLLNLKNSQSENPNFKYGNPIKASRTVVETTAQSIVNQVYYIYGTGRVELASTTVLAKTAQGLVIRELSHSGDGLSRTQDYCELLK